MGESLRKGISRRRIEEHSEGQIAFKEGEIHILDAAQADTVGKQTEHLGKATEAFGRASKHFRNREALSEMEKSPHG